MSRRALALAVGVVIVLAGCATPTPSDLDAETAGALQASVVEVATLAADGDVAGAIARLDTLQGEVDAAVASEALTDDRAAEIQAAIDAVRLDLEALVPEPTPTPSAPEQEPGKDKPGKGNKPEKPGKP